MKVAIVCYPTIGGSGIVATELANSLAHLGHQIHIISYSPPFRFNNYDYNENIFFHNVSLVSYPLFEFPLYSIALAGKIAEVVEEEKIEIVHCHYAIPHAISGIVAKDLLFHCNKTNVKVVTTLHGTDVTLVGNQPNLRKIVTYSLNKSDKITCVSNFLKRTTIDVFSPAKPIEMIHNFIDTNIFKRRNLPNLRKHFANEDQKIIIHISNFRPVKRTEDVIKVFNLIQKEIDSILLLVGDGPSMPNIENLIHDFKLEKKVFCLGEQNGVVDLLSISDLFILTSEIESFGLAALEALSCEVPVVCYNVGGLPEIIDDGQDGFLIPFGNIDSFVDKTLLLLRNDNLRKELGFNGRKKVVEKFDKDIIVPKYLNLYFDLFNNR
ncbi:MAG: N-acetyl-alpha-D-glucosaminyl L-malate synthase BshA [Ignavibacteria bacterium]|nr:N-acetyl-alpha-D-glucosaminyl L-malate synthase BshA [Ignavibacteria bacterium]